MMRRQQDQQSKVFYELSTLVLNILRSPPTSIEFPDETPVGSAGSSSSAGEVAVRRRQMGMQQLTPAGFASLLLGVSLALMLCGSVTFFIGFMLMPWVIGLVFVFYVVGVVSSLTMLGRAILCHSSTPSSPRNDCSYYYFWLISSLQDQMSVYGCTVCQIGIAAGDPRISTNGLTSPRNCCN